MTVDPTIPDAVADAVEVLAWYAAGEIIDRDSSYVRRVVLHPDRRYLEIAMATLGVMDPVHLPVTDGRRADVVECTEYLTHLARVHAAAHAVEAFASAAGYPDRDAAADITTELGMLRRGVAQYGFTTDQAKLLAQVTEHVLGDGGGLLSNDERALLEDAAATLRR